MPEAKFLLNYIPRDFLSQQLGRGIKDVMQRMTSNLQEACKRFDYPFENFVRQIIRTLMGNEFRCHPEETTKDPSFIVAGQTQSGKSAIKGVVIQSASVLQKIPCVIITKGVSESRELHLKLQNFFVGSTLEQQHIVNADFKGCGPKEKRLRIKCAVENGGVIVVADTESQIMRAVKAIIDYRGKNPNRKFVVIVDECDAMYRTEDRVQKMEQAYDKLIGLKPSLRVMISATVVPLLLILREQEENADCELFRIEPGADYMVSIL